jgi:predicted Rossmann fold flavoprotein
MRIAVIGAGASGLDGAIALKKKYPAAEVVVFEKEEKIGRKLYATGNGHCNLLNAAVKPSDFNHPDFIAPYLALYPFASLEKTLADWGVLTLCEGDYVYPLSYSAPTYVGFLSSLALSLGIRFCLGVRLLDYVLKGGKILLKVSANPASIDLSFDKLILASGGESTPKLGSDGSLYPLLKNHGYSLVAPLPGLAPFKVVHPETLKGLSGYRHEAKVSLLSSSGQTLYQEVGEVLYRDEGLSGIVVFNVESVYCRLSCPEKCELSLDLFPDLSVEELSARLEKSNQINPTFYGDAFFPKEVQAHFGFGLKKDFLALAKRLKDDRYLIKGSEGFEHSQVTVGGLALSEVKATFESRKEPGVYFTGEVLDIDGFCGGFNLTWALLSALIVRDSL